MPRSRTRKLIFLAWACALAFGLTYQVALADSLHAGCTAQCNRACAGECEIAEMVAPCTCVWVCSDGSTGRSICVE